MTDLRWCCVREEGVTSAHRRPNNQPDGDRDQMGSSRCVGASPCFLMLSIMPGVPMTSGGLQGLQPPLGRAGLTSKWRQDIPRLRGRTQTRPKFRTPLPSVFGQQYLGGNWNLQIAEAFPRRLA